MLKSSERIWAILGFLLLSATGSVSAQQPPESAQAPPSEISSDAHKDVKVPRVDHHFWDKKNDWLFAGVAASRYFDYFSTLNLRRRGDPEILLTNDIVDNHAAFAAIEAAGTGVSIGASYLFHRYHHHQLERWTSIVHIGLTSAGAIRNYSLKTAHPSVAP